MTLEQLDALYKAGSLPATIDGSLNLAEVAGLVETLPPVLSMTAAPDGRGNLGPAPRGYGVLPPAGTPPLIRVKSKLRDPYGKPIPARAQGAVGAVWHAKGRTTFRLWFRWGEEAEHGWTRGPVDIYDDQIAAVCGLGGEVPRMVGWQLVRLDHGSAEAQATLAEE